MDDIITLGSSSDEENDISIVCDPLDTAQPSTSSKTVEVIHLTPAPRPKIGADDAAFNVEENGEGIVDADADYKSAKPKPQGNCGPFEEITLSSGEEDDDVVDFAKVEGSLTPSPPLSCDDPSTSNGVKDEKDDADAVEILQDDGGNADDAGSECFISAPTDATVSIKKLLKIVYKKLSFCDRKALKLKLQKKYDKLSSEPPELLAILSERIQAVIRFITTYPQLNFWKLLKQLLEQFDADKLRSNEPFEVNIDEGKDKEEVELKKQRVKDKLERYLVKLSNEIEELDQKEVAWGTDDDDEDTPFIRAEALKKKYMRVYVELCNIDKCSKYTGRPVQKAIRLQNTTTYPEVEQAVEHLINSRGYIQMPEFVDFVDCIKKVNKDVPLNLDEHGVAKLAEEFHLKATDWRQRLRALDIPYIFPAECDNPGDDPAEHDDELAEKLRQNALKATCIKTLTENYTLQHEKLEKDLIEGNENEASLLSEDAAEDGSDDSNNNDIDSDFEDQEDIDTLESALGVVTTIGDDDVREAWEEPLFDYDDDTGSSASFQISPFGIESQNPESNDNTTAKTENEQVLADDIMTPSVPDEPMPKPTDEVLLSSVPSELPEPEETSKRSLDKDITEPEPGLSSPDPKRRKISEEQ